MQATSTRVSGGGHAPRPSGSLFSVFRRAPPLVEAGIDASRLEAHGFGSEQPLADNATVAGRAANRRVELRIVQ